MVLFNEREALLRLGRISPIAPGSPTGLGAVITESFTAMRSSDITLSDEIMSHEIYEREIDRIFQSTGEVLDNPYRGQQFTPKQFTLDDFEGFEPGLQPGPDEVGQEQLVQDFFNKATELGVARSPEELREEVLETVRSRQESLADTQVRAGGFARTVGTFLGSAGAIFTDPPVMLSMLAGAPAAAGILRTMVTEAAIGGVVEAAIQPDIQAFREEAGLPNQAVQNILFAIGGGAAFGGAIKTAGFGVGLGLAALRRSGATSEQAAAKVIQDLAVDVSETMPFAAETPVGPTTHVDRLAQTEASLLGSGRLGPTDAPPLTIRDDLLSSAAPRALRPTVINVTADAIDAERLIHRMGQELREQLLPELRAANLARAEQDLASRLAVFVRGLVPGALRGTRNVSEPQRLTDFLRRAGGLKPDPELRNLGIQHDTRPGLINRSGMTLDEARAQAAEAGFLGRTAEVEETNLAGVRKTDNRELLDALAEDVFDQRPRFTEAGEFENRAAVESRQEIDQTREALERLGLDADRLTDEEILNALDEIATPQPAAVEPSRAIVQQVDPRNAAEFGESRKNFDDIVEAEVRDEYTPQDGPDRLDDVIYVGEDGQIERLTARDIFKQLEDDQKLLDEWRNCVLSGIGGVV